MLDLVIAVAVLFPSVILHEVAHGYVAYRLGDPTAKDQGRLSLNPLRHISWMGTVILPALLAWAGLPVFGYAKPVPVDSSYFANPKRDMAKVAIAGPLVNLVLASLCLAYLNVVLEFLHPGLRHASMAYLQSGVSFWPGVSLVSGAVAFEMLIVNLMLLVFNLMPVPPLDGSRILYWLLPQSAGTYYYKLEKYGILIVFGLLYFNVFSWLYDALIGPLLLYVL